MTPDIDVRRATTVAAAGQASTSDNYLVGFRGANNINAPMANGAANGGTTASVPQSPAKDKALEIAVGVVRELPVAQL